MTEPQFEDGPPVPLMVQGVMDRAMLNQYFADLASHAAIASIREKHSPVANSSTQKITADELLARLLAAQTRAAQIRYRYDGAEWTDTILLAAEGYQIVRCRHDAAD